MNFFMGKKFVGPGGGKKDQGPEVVFDNGEESNKRMKRMLRPIKIAIVVAVLAIAAFDSFFSQFWHMVDPLFINRINNSTTSCSS